MLDDPSFIVLKVRGRVYNASNRHFSVSETFKTVSKTFIRPGTNPLLRDFAIFENNPY